jgi:hypothetical protein
MKVPGTTGAEGWIFNWGNNMSTEKFTAQPDRLHACVRAVLQSYMT